MQLSENARRELEARFLRRDTQGKLSETPDQLFSRVARAIAHAELLLGNREQAALREERFHTLLTTMFKGVTVGDVMNTSPVTVPANISLQKLVHDLLLPRGWRSAFVMQIDHLVGLITLSEIRHVPRDEWRQTPVGHAMISVDRLHVVSPRQSLNEVLPLMVARDVNQLPVIEDGRLVGVLSREDVMRFLEIRRGLGLDEAASNRLVREREDRRWVVGFRIGCRTSYRWRYVECELRSTAEAAFSCEGIPPEQALFQDRAEEGNDDNASVFTS